MNRQLYKSIAAASLALTLSLTLQVADAADAPSDTIPSHRPVWVPGVHAYAEKSLAAGETIHFRVSSTHPYELSIRRLGGRVDDPGSDTTLHTFAPSSATQQPIHPGSYVHVEKGLSTDAPLEALTLACWVRPWRLEGRQGLITQDDGPERCGIALRLGDTGQLEACLGDGGARRDEACLSGPGLEMRVWQHVAATWDGKRLALWVNGRPAGERDLGGTVRAASAPLRLGASGLDGVSVEFLDGDLARPGVYNRALEASELQTLAKAEAPPADIPSGALAFWPLDEERGQRVADGSPHARHGRIINRGTWMIGGPAFHGEDVPRYTPYDPRQDPARGHGLRLASDDLYDCRWNVTHEYRLPESAKSGLYNGRFRYDMDGHTQVYNVTFIVRRPTGRPAAPILVLCSTSTWLAYNATPFAIATPPHAAWNTNGRPNSHALAPAYSMYRDHSGGQPTYQMGLRLPWPVAGPDVLYSPREIGYSHLMRGERFAHAWLDDEGYAYDVVSDLDLHKNPDMLGDYKVVLINGHSEYWSHEAYNGLERFLQAGGNALVLSGNTMFWRVSFDATGTVMECRKYPIQVGGRRHANVGELYHSDDGKRGGLLRECGAPAWKAIGLECVGWWGTGKADRYGVYSVEEPGHFLFQGPEKISLARGDTFGHAPGGGLPRAGGHEADVRLSTLKKLPHTVPAGAVFPEEPEGIVTLARMYHPRHGALGYFVKWGENPEHVVAEMIYWERPQGGRVFHGGTIASGWVLSADSKMRALLRNVLAHFGVKL